MKNSNRWLTLLLGLTLSVVATTSCVNRRTDGGSDLDDSRVEGGDGASSGGVSGEGGSGEGASGPGGVSGDGGIAGWGGGAGGGTGGSAGPGGDGVELSGLDANVGDLAPAFEEDHYTYSIHVPLRTKQIELTPTAGDGSTITVAGDELESGASWESPVLHLGKNTFDIVVSRDELASAVYRVEVYRGDLDGYVTGENPQQRLGFAETVALSSDGTTLAVGAPYHDKQLDEEQYPEELGNGSVYVFVRSESGWTQQAQIEAPNADLRDFFGQAVALDEDGNTLVVGAHREDSAARTVNGDGTSNAAIDSGAAYVFVRSSGTWQHQAYLKASNADAGDMFGFSAAVSADGRSIVIGAPHERGTSNALHESGAVYVFTWNAGAWSEQGHLQSPNPDSFDRFGWTVDVSRNGTTVAVGVPNDSSKATGINGDETNNDEGYSGAVYVFESNSSNWLKTAYIKASNNDQDDNFGWALRLAHDGRTLVVAAPYEDSNATGVNGDDSNKNSRGSGAVYVFTKPASTWSQVAYLKSAAPDRWDSFGWSLGFASSSGAILVGATSEDGASSSFGGNPRTNTRVDSGGAYFFERVDATWVLKGYIKAPTNIAYDSFGRNLALAADGGTFAISSRYVNGVTTNRAGVTYIYR